jgi:copper chaperone
MQYRIEVENIKCGGCANTIRRKLLEDARIQQVAVDIEGQTVTVEAEEDVTADAVRILAASGYPRRGSVEGLSSVKAKAASFVSCAIGRLDG